MADVGLLHDPDILQDKSGHPHGHVPASSSHMLSSALQEEEDVLGFVCHVNAAINQTVLGRCLFVTCLVLAVTNITVGILRYSTCPCEPMIPVFLVVEGAAILLKSIVIVLQAYRKSRSDDEPQTARTLDGILTVFLVCWTLTGSVWVYGMNVKVKHSRGLNTSLYQCDTLLYWYAFSLLSIAYLYLLGKAVLMAALCAVFFRNDSVTYRELEPNPEIYIDHG